MTCPACRAQFTEDDLDRLQVQEIALLPNVEPCHAARMLGMPAAALHEQRHLLEAKPNPLPGIDYVFPLTAIRRFAAERRLAITPGPVVLWLDKPAQT